MTAPLASIRGLLIDLDGVVYTGAMPIPGGDWFLATARRHGLPFLLVTNNSTAEPSHVVRRLGGMGIAVREDEILTSAQAGAAYLRTEVREGDRVLVVGEEGLLSAVRAQGLPVTDKGSEAAWVLVGLDRAFTYARLTEATQAILGGAGFVATNKDALLPIEGGQFLPGAGSMVGAIRGATGIEPTIIGKPERILFDRARERLGFPADAVAMIGDRVDTDIVGAQRAGLRTVLVLSGIATREEADALQPAPDAILDRLASLSPLLGWEDEPPPADA